MLDTYSPDGNYQVLRKMIVGGVTLVPGDILPHDSVIREQRRKIESLCRQRKLAPAAAQVEAKAASKAKK